MPSICRDGFVHCVEACNRSVVGRTFRVTLLGISRVRPLVSQSGTDSSPLTTLRSTSTKADCAERECFPPKSVDAI